jgi:hypothetical protein
MKFASVCEPFIEKVERAIARIVDEAVSADKSRVYINTVSEVKSFIKNFKGFLNTLKLVEEHFPDLKVGRPCFRWVYVEDANNIALTRLEHGLSMIFTGDYLRITYNDRSLTLYGIPRIGIKVNEYTDEISLEDEENVVTKRSLIVDVINIIRSELEKSIENLSLCIKYVKLKA